ncbi:MAG: flavodoxin family protein [Actinobacteria bacterium]|nr:flavodoxin family protein [Actinomycetota bacterium]
MDALSPKILLLCGSPRDGSTNYLASLIARGIEEAGGTPTLFRLSEHTVIGCDACDVCQSTGTCVKTAGGFDDFGEFEELLFDADMFVVVTPVYFANVPSYLKALYDRFQTYWARRYILGNPVEPKRPGALFIVGGGGDPFGYEPVIITTRSVMNVAGFSLGNIYDYIGFSKDDKDAEKEAKAVEDGRGLVEYYKGLNT